MNLKGRLDIWGGNTGDMPATLSPDRQVKFFDAKIKASETVAAAIRIGFFGLAPLDERRGWSQFSSNMKRMERWT